MSTETDAVSTAPARSGPWVEVDELVAQLFADAPRADVELPRADRQRSAAADRRHQHEARRAERAASRLLEVFSTTTTFLRELRRGLHRTEATTPTETVSQETEDQQAPQDAACAARGSAGSAAPIVCSAILMSWSVVLLRFGHTRTAAGFAAVGGVVAWVALLTRRS